MKNLTVSCTSKGGNFIEDVLNCSERNYIAYVILVNDFNVIKFICIRLIKLRTLIIRPLSRFILT